MCAMWSSARRGRITRKVAKMPMNDRIKLTHYPDVREPNGACHHEWFVGHPNAISVNEIVVDRCFGNWDETFSLGVDQILRIINSLEDFKKQPFILSHWICTRFVSSGQVARYKRYWKSPTGLKSPPLLTKGTEVEIANSHSHVSYATAAFVNHDILLDTIIWLRRRTDGHLFINTKPLELDEETILEFFEQTKKGMPNDYPAEYVPFAKYVTDNSGIYLRFWGSFDDPELSIQLYFRPDLIELPLN